MKATFFKPLVLSLCVGALLSPCAYADNFVQLHPKPKTRITPLNNFDKSLQREIQKHPKGTAFIIDARTGKIIATTPQKNPILKAKPSKAKPPKPAKKPKTPPYNMSEEYIELL